MEINKGSRPHVRFETRSEEDRAASVAEGKKVYKDVDWVMVTASGGRDEYQNKVEFWLRSIEDRAQVGQYDPEWVSHFKKMYQMFKDGKALPEDGTPLRMCSTLFSPGEIETCLAANIRTLEQLANANEEAMGRMPMMGRALKTRAQEAVKAGEKGESAMKIEALTVQNAELQDKISDMAAVIRDMQEQMQTMIPAGEKRGPGRPPKHQEAVA